MLFYFIIFVWSGVTAVKTTGPWQVFGQYVSFGHWPGLKLLLSVGGVLLLLIFIGSLFVQRFFADILPYGSNLFTDFTDIFPEN